MVKYSGEVIEEELSVTRAYAPETVGRLFTPMEIGQMQANMYIGEYQPAEDGDHAHQYAAAKCLKCGLCLEVCPNYVDGQTFFGAAFANDCYLVASRNAAEDGRVRALYAEHFGKTCSKSLSCMDICPMKIPTLASIAKLNLKKD